MPTYNYECTECGKVFDVIKRISEYNTAESCTGCKSEKTVKVISCPQGFVFKGEGFYETEHGKQQHNK